MHSLSTTHVTHTEVDKVTGRGATSILRDRGSRHSEAMCMTHVSQNVFRRPNNIIKYDGKTNPSVWLEDYRRACRVGGADNNLFIIQFLPIFLADMTRAWLDHLPRNMIDS
jgi:hypothetical protein